MVAQESNPDGPSFSVPCPELTLERLVNIGQLMSASRSKEHVYQDLVFFLCVCHSRESQPGGESDGIDTEHVSILLSSVMMCS